METQAEQVPTQAKKPVCFVIMPIADIAGYEQGHFSRVYEYLLKPAITAAGYQPIRADDENKTDYIVVGIIKRIIESEMVICDFSARNPNVMYELGIRHAFNKPVALIKDKKTDRIFDIQGLRHIEYDETLRIDSVQKDVSKITDAIKETSKLTPDTVNSVVQLAGIQAAEPPSSKIVSSDTQLILQMIGDLQRNIVSTNTDAKTTRHFIIEDEEVIFDDKTTAKLQENVYNSSGNIIGTIVDIHPGEEKIYIKISSGRVIPYAATSIKSKGISASPF